jgi:hypothetical protein
MYTVAGWMYAGLKKTKEEPHERRKAKEKQTKTKNENERGQTNDAEQEEEDTTIQATEESLSKNSRDQHPTIHRLILQSNHEQRRAQRKERKRRSRREEDAETA